MKKSLLAVAVLGAFAGAASAQSSVTLFGIADASIGSYSATGSSSAVRVLSGNNMQSNRFGVRGIEDLGGGLKAGFHLEAGQNLVNGTGQATTVCNTTAAACATTGNQGLSFNRRSTVSIGGNFGEVRLGRDYTPTFDNQTMYDAFATNGVGSQFNLVAGAQATNTRASNSIAYWTPGNFNGTIANGNAWGGFGAQVMYAASNTDLSAGRYVGGRVSYDQGPVSVSLATGSTGNYTGVAGSGSAKQTNFGASYNFGVVKLIGFYGQNQLNTAAKTKGYSLGFVAPVGMGNVRGSVARGDNGLANGKATQYAVGYDHNLSKRTIAYAYVGRVSNKSGSAIGINGGIAPTAGGSSTGLQLGLSHSF